jgi:Protein similar to CwfJ C-terminus 1/Protein similar to CwfJ C-terminus 2/Zinc knuckle
MVKVIVTGDVARLDLLASKITALNGSAVGPFDAVFVSNLLDVAGLNPYTGSEPKSFPVPLYFLTADEAAVPKELFELGEPRIRCLSNAGHAILGGLRVAWAHVRHSAGGSNPSYAGLLDTCRNQAKDRPHGRESVFDLLLTNLPPTAGFTECGPSAPRAIRALPDSLVSAEAAFLASAAEPRYHFCPAASYFQRAPYKNASNSGICTRLISIAPFDGVSDGKGENKNLHALNLTPSPSVDIKTLLDVPEGTTASPYAPAVGAAANRPAITMRLGGAGASAAARAALGSLAGKTVRDESATGGGDSMQPPAAKRPRHEEGVGSASSSSSSSSTNNGLSAEQVAALEAEAMRGGGRNDGQLFWGGRGAARGPPGVAGVGAPLVGMGLPQGGAPGQFQQGAGVGARRPPPPHYICNACKIAGHWIQDCPQVAAKRAAREQQMQQQMQQQQPLGNQGKPADCWFCLASPQVEKHLIVAIGEESYLALPKGPVDASTHALIIPITHHVSLATAPPSLQKEVRRFVNALAAMYASKGLVPVLFERVLQARRGETPNHTHLQIIGVPKDSTAAQAESTFLTEGAFKQVPFTKLPPSAASESGGTTDGPFGRFDELLPHVAASSADATAVQIPSAAADGSAATAATEESTDGSSSGKQAVCEYLYVETPASSAAAAGAGAGAASTDGGVARLLHKVPPGTKHPVQFGREVLCRLLNCPDKLSWKTCAVGAEGETAATGAFRKAFAPYDFTSEESEEEEADADGSGEKTGAAAE